MKTIMYSMTVTFVLCTVAILFYGMIRVDAFSLFCFPTRNNAGISTIFSPDITFQNTDYTIVVVAAFNKSVIAVYPKNRTREGVGFKYRVDTVPYEHVVDDTLSVTIPGKKREKAKWNNVYFISKTGCVVHICYDCFFQEKELKELMNTDILESSQLIQERILAYMEKNPYVVQ